MVKDRKECTYMIVGSQSTLKLNELLDRKKRGVRFVELQVTLDDFDDFATTISRKHELKQQEIQIYAIAVPEKNKYNQPCTLGVKNPMWHKENISTIKRTIVMADKLNGGSKSTKVIVSLGGVLQNGDTKQEIKELKTLFQNDVTGLKSFVRTNHPNVELVFKNNPLIDIDGDEEKLYGYGYENDFIGWLKEMGDEQVQVCLDIGNALMTIKEHKTRGIESKFKSLTEYVEAYAPFLKLIHISQTNLFTGKKEGFNAEKSKDKEIIGEVMDALQKINYTFPITLTAEEEQKDNAVLFTETRNCILKSLKSR